MHCEQPFTPKDGRANRRSYCYDPECVKKHKTYSYRMKAEATRRWKAAQRGLKPSEDALLCNVCHQPLPEGYRFRHDQCAAKVAKYHRIDDDYLFCFDNQLEVQLDMEDFF